MHPKRDVPFWLDSERVWEPEPLHVVLPIPEPAAEKPTDDADDIGSHVIVIDID